MPRSRGERSPELSMTKTGDPLLRRLLGPSFSPFILPLFKITSY